MKSYLIIVFLLLHTVFLMEIYTQPIVSVQPGSNNVTLNLYNRTDDGYSSVRIEPASELPRWFISFSSQSVSIDGFTTERAVSLNKTELTFTLVIDSTGYRNVIIPFNVVLDGETKKVIRRFRAALMFDNDTTGVMALMNAGEFEPVELLPERFELYQNYPNPFNVQTVTRYDIPEKVKVTVVLYDVLGRKVRTLVDDMHDPGFYKTTFDASEYASGMYIYRIQAGEFQSVHRMMLVK